VNPHNVPAKASNRQACSASHACGVCDFPFPSPSGGTRGGWP